MGCKSRGQRVQDLLRRPARRPLLFLLHNRFSAEQPHDDSPCRRRLVYPRSGSPKVCAAKGLCVQGGLRVAELSGYSKQHRSLQVLIFGIEGRPQGNVLGQRLQAGLGFRFAREDFHNSPAHDALLLGDGSRGVGDPRRRYVLSRLAEGPGGIVGFSHLGDQGDARDRRLQLLGYPERGDRLGGRRRHGGGRRCRGRGLGGRRGGGRRRRAGCGRRRRAGRSGCGNGFLGCVGGG
ncbi:hypothetical protein GD627_12110 [Arthrobacter yangruifuii]|uniref:Uncharacterized protein n=1 Tax=Arthrobacter yangruifuii TaxID=2606616 RepID=A0A5N6MHT3_9MICC|nr:hypothetical protein GD627_12110 [Arthrobacter yangruifuii]